MGCAEFFRIILSLLGDFDDDDGGCAAGFQALDDAEADGAGAHYEGGVAWFESVLDPVSTQECFNLFTSKKDVEPFIPSDTSSTLSETGKIPT